ncbi:uncharacterized protein M421DRAFT_366106 [Didymella exigua CBS 183.55]|uniref:Secreted protein n=1 Tax=Didymella exigua CBS 183.55 TaxID=1150837 RepID=A0A6A5R354_9PLEO|nr:uncharacterized protein M421DRAFT_366106 [Didymella exigua CBS 183.55]KAF1922481.1 hypothetical protein M421DRAFT_366106 [Didymella exigua CBS 183.55]
MTLLLLLSRVLCRAAQRSTQHFYNALDWTVKSNGPLLFCRRNSGLHDRPYNPSCAWPKSGIVAGIRRNPLIRSCT